MALSRPPSRQASSTAETLAPPPVTQPPTRSTASPPTPMAARRKKKKKKKRRSHRAYGLPNANQILAGTTVVALLFVQLLWPNWIKFDNDDLVKSAGIVGFIIKAYNSSTVRVSWHTLCDVDERANVTIPIGPNSSGVVFYPLVSSEVRDLCEYDAITQVLAMTIVGIVLASFSVLTALYLHLGTPSQRLIEILGFVPGITLATVAVLNTASLIIWTSDQPQLTSDEHKGECLGIAIAATAVAYLTSISMIIRWRFPGICAVPNEQQAFADRNRWHPPPTAQDSAAAAIPASPRAAGVFHQVT